MASVLQAITATVLLLSCTGLVRCTGAEEAMMKLIDCQRLGMDAYRECYKDMPLKWKVCHDFYVWEYDYSKHLYVVCTET